MSVYTTGFPPLLGHLTNKCKAWSCSHFNVSPTLPQPSVCRKCSFVFMSSSTGQVPKERASLFAFGVWEEGERKREYAHA